jgi:hypothetical protein
MQKNPFVTTDSEVTSRKSETSSNTHCSSKKMTEGQMRPRSNRSKLMALQDALQDPVIACEGF